MKRRKLLIASGLSLIGVSVMADLPKIQNLNEALKWLDKLETAKSVSSTGAWSVNEVLEHLAQSIEYSITGFPQAKSAAFQNTVGAMAFSYFKWRGAMSHGLAEPIPGAPALNKSQDLHAAMTRLRRAIESFNAHQGALKPHFAYGQLSKSDFALAHAFHIANHQDELLVIEKPAT